jgi:hypothetical protein
MHAWKVVTPLPKGGKNRWRLPAKDPVPLRDVPGLLQSVASSDETDEYGKGCGDDSHNDHIAYLPPAAAEPAASAIFSFRV